MSGHTTARASAYAAFIAPETQGEELEGAARILQALMAEAGIFVRDEDETAYLRSCRRLAALGCSDFAGSMLSCMILDSEHSYS